MPGRSGDVRSSGKTGSHGRAVKATRLPSKPRKFHPEPLTDPDLNLSIHPARAIDWRLPPSVELRAPPVASWPDSSSMTRPLRSTTIRFRHFIDGSLALASLN